MFEAIDKSAVKRNCECSSQNAEGEAETRFWKDDDVGASSR